MSNLQFSVFAILVIALVSGSYATTYNDNLFINSRVPGDQVIQSGRAIQHLNFQATTYVEVRYPDVLPKSDYMLTHLTVDGKDDTGYLDVKLESGGPGSDNMRIKVILNSIQNGDFQYNLYGKKK